MQGKNALSLFDFCSCSWGFVLQWLLLLLAPHCNWNKFHWGHNWQNTARTNVPHPLSILALGRENRMESAPTHSLRKCVWGEGCMYIYDKIQHVYCHVGKGDSVRKGGRAILCMCWDFFLCSCTSELKRIWQTLHEMTGRLVLISGTPKVWFITAFCTGSIWQRNDKGRDRSVSHNYRRPGATIRQASQS